MKKEWILASRGSKLALWQAEFVRKSLLSNFPDCLIRICVIQTAGDTRSWDKLWQMGDKGVFTKEIEDALQNGEADFAVHSLKDMPTEISKGLMLGAIPVREEPCDVLISKDNVLFENLPLETKIGTSSFRRRSQLLRMRPDLKIEDIRGNVHTRIKKVQEGLVDATVMAKAGVLRLGLEEWITQEFSMEEMLPAVGQGALAVEIREGDDEAREIIQSIADENLFKATASERSFLKGLGGGCRMPIAAYGQVRSDEIILEGLVASMDGAKVIREKISGRKEDFETLGLKLAQMVLNAGGKEIDFLGQQSLGL